MVVAKRSFDPLKTDVKQNDYTSFSSLCKIRYKGLSYINEGKVRLSSAQRCYPYDFSTIFQGTKKEKKSQSKSSLLMQSLRCAF